MTTLKPCPFCGGTDVNAHSHHSHPMVWISCVECGLEGPSETGTTEEMAAAHWNRRPQVEALQAENDKLRAERDEALGLSDDDFEDVAPLIQALLWGGDPTPKLRRSAANMLRILADNTRVARQDIRDTFKPRAERAEAEVARLTEALDAERKNSARMAAALAAEESRGGRLADEVGSLRSRSECLAARLTQANKLVGRIEDRFPNWRSFRDIEDCIDCTIAALKGSTDDH